MSQILSFLLHTVRTQENWSYFPHDPQATCQYNINHCNINQYTIVQYIQYNIAHYNQYNIVQYNQYNIAQYKWYNINQLLGEAREAVGGLAASVWGRWLGNDPPSHLTSHLMAVPIQVIQQRDK